MVFPTILLKLADWLVYRLLSNSCYRASTKVGNYGFSPQNTYPKSSHHHQQQQQPHSFPSLTKCDFSNSTRRPQTSVFDINGTLLRCRDFFPFFMLVAFEGGSILRAFLLLLSSPLLWVLDYETKLRVMIFITFFGFKSNNMESVSRAVLPKFYLENLNLQVYEAIASTQSKVVFTSVPRVMVEGFLKDYLNVDEVFGTELQTYDRYFTGLVSSSSGILVKHRALKDYFGDSKPDIGIGGLGLHDYLFISQCKEAYVVNKEDRKSSAKTVMTRDRYPKPLVFHDGRLAFLPTPLAMLSMFMWLPLGIILAVFRLLVGIYLPYNIAIFFGCLSGVNIRVKGSYPNSNGPEKRKGGVLFVCTHRTLLDPVFLSTSLGKPLTAVTYSLSKMSEMIAPIKTVRLTRDRAVDSETMQKLLSEGDLVVCPEGTTCREPYLLRFRCLSLRTKKKQKQIQQL